MLGKFNILCLFFLFRHCWSVIIPISETAWHPYGSYSWLLLHCNWPIRKVCFKRPHLFSVTHLYQHASDSDAEILYILLVGNKHSIYKKKKNLTYHYFLLLQVFCCWKCWFLSQPLGYFRYALCSNIYKTWVSILPGPCALMDLGSLN